MKKITIPNNSWAYEDFITDEEQKDLLKFCKSLFIHAKENGPGRFFCDQIVSKLNPPEVYFNVRNRIIQTEEFKNYKDDTVFGDFVGFNYESGAIHEHTDKNLDGFVHTRYNLLISFPEIGGQPIYGGKIIDVKEKMLWRCQAGLIEHASTPVKGPKPRINISFGFQIKE